MTPFEVSLEREIEVEQLRFANEWLFPWHNLRNSINVDRFDGGRIQLGDEVWSSTAEHFLAGNWTIFNWQSALNISRVGRGNEGLFDKTPKGVARRYIPHDESPDGGCDPEGN